MKYALFINSLDGGGAERVVISLLHGMLKRGIKIELICIEKKNSYELPKELKVHYLTNKYLITNNLLKLLYIPILGFRLKRLVKRHNFTTIESHLIRANILNVTSKIFGSIHKSIIVNHNMVSFTKQLGLKGRFKLIIMKFFYSRADLMLYISKVMQRDFQNTFHFENQGKVIFNPHILEELKIQSKIPVKGFDFDPNIFYIVTSGRLIGRKRVVDLIDAIQQVRNTIPNVELIILGNGPDHEKVVNYTAKIQAENHIHMLGFKSNPFQYISNSDLFVMTSEREGLPNVLIESMACATTVVSSDCLSGPREIIAPNSDLFYQLKEGSEYTPNGVLFAIGDIENLTKIIIDLLNKKDLRSKLSKNALQRIKDFDLDVIVTEHESVFA